MLLQSVTSNSELKHDNRNILVHIPDSKSTESKRFVQGTLRHVHIICALLYCGVVCHRPAVPIYRRVSSLAQG